MLRIEFRSPLRFEYEVRAKFWDVSSMIKKKTFTLKDLKIALKVKTLEN